MHWKELDVWQKAHELVLTVYNVSKELPKEEMYSLISQIRRAAYSIPVNIVEGNCRKSTKEYLQFLSIARGSLEELRYFFILMKDLEYITIEKYEILEKSAVEVSKMLNGLIRVLNLKVKN